MESDAYSSHVFIVHHPFFMGGNSKGATVKHQRAAGRAHHARSQAPEHPLHPAPGSLCKADPPAARAPFRNHDTAEHWALCSWPQIFQKLIFE